MAKPPWRPPAARDKKYPRISGLITEVVDGFRVTVWRVRSGALWDAALLADELAAADEAIAIVKRYAAAEMHKKVLTSAPHFSAMDRGVGRGGIT